MFAVSARRRKRQSGQEMFEFAATAFLLLPMLMGGFVTGMGLIRSIVVNQAARDLANIYIHGGDFSTYSMQQVAERLATGLSLSIGSGFTGNQKDNLSSNGDTLVLVSQIQWVGPTSGSICNSVGASLCANANSFVFLQRIRFGNSSLLTQSPNTLGDPTTTAMSNSGVLTNPYKDTGSKLPSAKHAAMVSLWQVSTGGRTPLVDGQVIYCVEVFSRSPQFTVGSFGGGAQYARYFF